MGRHLLAAAVASAVIVLALALNRCGGGHEVTLRTGDIASVSGRIIKGPLARGLVSAYRFDAQMRRGDLLASAPTDESGSFSVRLPAYTGHILLVANAGTYSEEAVGTATSLGSFELTAIVPDYQALSTVTGILVTPLSHWAAGLAAHYVRDEGQSFTSAYNEAWQHLNAHFGNFDWRQTSPTDLTDGGVSYDTAGKAGLLLAALSMHARSISERAGLTPGSAVTAITLTKALYDDISFDGYFDGQGANGNIILPTGGQVTQQGPTAYQLDGQSVRLSYALAIEHFLQSNRNGSRITSADARQLLETMSNNSNPRIFRTPGQAYTSEPPTVEIVDTIPSVVPESPLSFSVRASNPRQTGIRAVFARNGSLDPVRGTLDAGLWNFTLPLNPGPNTVWVWAEDNAIPPNSGENFGAPYRRSADVSFTRVPPTVEFVSTPPQYTRTRPLLFQVRAVNPTRYGVGRVLAQVGNATPVVGNFDSSVWNFTVPLLDGRNAVAIWAEDNGSPPASGAGLPPPYQRIAEVLYSNRVIDAAIEPFPSYLDEQTMGVRESSPGIPYVPVQYTFQTTQRVPITSGSSVWKTSTRLSWGPTPPAGVDLEGANSSNTPFVQYRIGYTPQVDAPITSATYSVGLRPCPTCGIINAGGNLTAAARTAPGQLFFDLPLASENLPALNQLTYAFPAALTLRVDFGDAAGNTGSLSSVTLTFHILGPPLSSAEDTSYNQTSDPKSVYTHRISNGSYASLWTRSTFGTEHVVRFIRYIIRNPHSTPVQVRIDNPGPFGMTNRWNAEVWQWSQPYWRDSRQIQPSYNWTIAGPACGTPNFPCGTNYNQYRTMFPLLWAGPYSQMICGLLPSPGPVSGVDQPYNTGSTNLVSSVWRLDDETQPAANVGGRYVVSPAVGPNPGGVVVYTGRQFAEGYQPPLDYQVLENPSGQPHYYNWQYDFWVRDGNEYLCCPLPPASCLHYRGYRYATVLIAATERLDGSAIFSAFAPSSSPPDPLGEGRPIANYRVQREVGH
jgi:hypothetical protein